MREHDFRPTRRQFIRAGAGLTGAVGMGLSAGFLAACANATSSIAPPSVSPRRGGHLVEASNADITTFNPVLTADGASRLLAPLLFDGLLSVDRNGTSIPMLASALPTASSDGTRFTFRLRNDARWSDGHPITANDVVFTYRLMYDPAYRAVNSPYRGDLEQLIQSVTAPDASTVVFTLTKPNAPFLVQHAWHGILPQHVLGSVPATAFNTAPFNSGPTVVSGAFGFDRWDKGQRVSLSRNSSYYRGPALLDAYIYSVVTDLNSLTAQLKTGEVDLVHLLDPSQLAGLASADNVNIVRYTDNLFLFFGFQLDPAKPGSRFFGDVRVRQALMTALNRDQMVATIFAKEALRADSVLSPSSWAYNAKVSPVYRADPVKAGQLLDAAGWTKDPAGVRAKGGLQMRFTMWTNSGNQLRSNALQIMQDEWKKIGVIADIKTVAFPQLIGQIYTERTFDIFLVAQVWGADPDSIATLFHSRNGRPGGFNGMRYSNPQVDSLIDEAAATLDTGRRKSYYAQVQDILATDLPAPFLAFQNGLWAANKRVQGLQLSAIDQIDFRPWMKDVYVTAGG